MPSVQNAHPAPHLGILGSRRPPHSDSTSARETEYKLPPDFGRRTGAIWRWNDKKVIESNRNRHGLEHHVRNVAYWFIKIPVVRYRTHLCKFETDTRHPDDQPIWPGADVLLGISQVLLLLFKSGQNIK